MTSPEEYRDMLNDLDARLGTLYQERRKIMEAFAEDHPVSLPPPRFRTETQQRVARCPRCGTKLTSTESSSISQ